MVILPCRSKYYFTTGRSGTVLPLPYTALISSAKPPIGHSGDPNRLNCCLALILAPSKLALPLVNDPSSTGTVQFKSPWYSKLGTDRRADKEWQPDALVVGLPLNMTAHPAICAYVQKNCTTLKWRFNLPVHTHDERLTTLQLKASVYRKDSNAAAIENNLLMP